MIHSVSDRSGLLRSIPQNAQTTNYQLTIDDNGKHISIRTGFIVVPNNVFGVGNVITIFNNSAVAMNIANAPNANVIFSGRGTLGNTSLGQYGLATLLCVAANTFVISGAGLN
jgi:hypothetical protein